MADQRIGSSSSPPHENEAIKSSGTASSSKTKSSIYTPPSAFSSDSGYKLSDSRIPSLKSLNENSSPEGGSSDGWSMRAFTELVASSQRERWSFDSENSYSIKSRMTRSSTKKQPSIDLETCGVCLQLLKERDTKRIVYIDSLSVVAVLTCGHLYHADCLEGVTRETDRFDPVCPTCTNGERSGSKLLRKSEPPKVKSKLSRIAVADVDSEFDSISECEQRDIPKSASMKGSFGRPFLSRHFSFGSRSRSEVEPSRKKSGFWARHRRD